MTINIHPANTKINPISELCDLSIDVQDIKTDVDIISIAEEIISKVQKSNESNILSISPYFDTHNKIYVGYDSCIIEYSFKYTNLMNVGEIEKDLIRFDIFYNGVISPVTLVIIEALTLTRKAFKWKEYLDYVD